MISEGGKRYTIELRRDVKFHNGEIMTVADVVASLNYWLQQSSRGRATSKEIASVASDGEHTVVINLKDVYAPLLAQLALPVGMAAVMPEKSIAQPLTEFIGTGPYRLKERKPDQYILLERFDGYSTLDVNPSGYAGKKQALIRELRFVPVPDISTRVEGALASQYDFSDLLPPEALPRLDAAKGKTVAVLTKSFGYPYLVFNTKEGIMANEALRGAVQATLGEGDMLAAGFGDPRFYKVVGSHFPKGSLFYSTAGTELYNQRDATKARTMAHKAGYKGEKVRILTSRQYGFHYNMALVMAEQMKQAGFKPHLDVVDWATLVQRRNDPKLWDIYITHSGQLPEPMLAPPQLGDNAPGWWNTPRKKAVLKAFNTETNPMKRGQLWGPAQETVYTEVPYIYVGRFSALTAHSPRLEGYTPMTWPFFWNTRIA